MRKKRPLDRKAKPVRDASLVVIASEDRYAVRQYFDFFESSRIQFRVLETEDGKSAPEHVLKRIDDYMEEFEIGEGDMFWVVCDCDHWVEPNHIKNLASVLQQCHQKHIHVALSNPCFDLWLLLHFFDFPTEEVLTCNEVADRLRDAAGGYDKTKVYNLRIDEQNVSAAVTRAANKHSTGRNPEAVAGRGLPRHPVPRRQEDLGSRGPAPYCQGGKKEAEGREGESRRRC